MPALTMSYTATKFSRPLRGLYKIPPTLPAVETAGYFHPSRFAGLQQHLHNSFAP